MEMGHIENRKNSFLPKIMQIGKTFVISLLMHNILLIELITMITNSQIWLVQLTPHYDRILAPILALGSLLSNHQIMLSSKV